MKQNNQDRILLGASIGGFAVLAVSFLLMPLEGVGILPGILFWVGLLTGTVLQIVLNAHRKKVFAKHNIKRITMQKQRCGLLSFASNLPAAVADGVMLLSLVATVLTFVLTKGIGYLCYVCLAVLVLSFSLHCILNGTNYVYVSNYDKLRQSLDKNGKNAEKGEGKV